MWDVAVDGAARLSWSFITSFASINADQAGIEAALMGTLWLMAVCAAFIIPVGVATAIYLEEYADNTKWYNRLIEVNIQNLAAVPSIVYGILGLAFLVSGPLGLGRVLLAGPGHRAVEVAPTFEVVYDATFPVVRHRLNSTTGPSTPSGVSGSGSSSPRRLRWS